MASCQSALKPGPALSCKSRSLPGVHSRQVNEASDHHFQLTGFDGQRYTLFGAYFQTQRNGSPNIFQRRILGFALAHTAGNGSTFRNPNAVFIAINGNIKFPQPDVNLFYCSFLTHIILLPRIYSKFDDFQQCAHCYTFMILLYRV